MSESHRARVQYRVRIGVLVPPGNPTVEPELYRMAPAQVTIHFARLDSGAESGDPGSRTAMEDRTRAYLAGLPLVARGLAQVRPAVVVLAHTASSYANGFANEPALVERLSSLTGAPGVTAAGAVRAALQHLGAKRLALGTPYQESVSLQGRAYWQAAGLGIGRYRRLGRADAPRPRALRDDPQRVYSLSHSQANFAAFRAAGGRGTFSELEAPPNPFGGHGLFAYPDVWASDVDAYLKRRGLP